MRLADSEVCAQYITHKKGICLKSLPSWLPSLNSSVEMSIFSEQLGVNEGYGQGKGVWFLRGPWSSSIKSPENLGEESAPLKPRVEIT